MKHLLTLLALLCTINSAAQDVIVTKEGNALKVWGIDISSTAVFYRENEAKDSPIKRMDKNELLLIKFQDGRKLIIGEETENAAPQSNQQTLSYSQSGVSDPDANSRFISGIRNNKVEFVGEASNSEAGMLFCQYFPKRNSVMSDKNVSFSVSTEAVGLFNNNKRQPLAGSMNLNIKVKNLTRKTIYVDLGNTFLIRGDQTLAYYVPTVTSHSSGTTTGVGVNMGAVTGALGVGGALGTLAGGIGVGSSRTNTTTVSEISQRVIAVPPMAEKRIDVPMTLFPRDASELYSDEFRYAGTYRELSIFLNKSDMLKVGECRDLDENFNVGAFGVVVTYADDETISNPQMLNAEFSVQRIIGTKPGKKLDMKYFNVEYVSDNYKNTAHFYARQRKM